MVRTHLLLAAVWILYCVLHSGLATSQCKLIIERWMRGQFKFYRLYYSIFALVSLIVILIFQISFHSPTVFIPGRILSLAGLFISAFGFLIMSICIKKYFMQASGLKGILRNNPGATELMKSGIHRMVRHPLYSGTFIFIWGLCIVFPYASSFIATGIITIYTIIGLRFEEKKLENEFGSDYILYKQTVPMIIPRIKLPHMGH